MERDLIIKKLRTLLSKEKVRIVRRCSKRGHYKPLRCKYCGEVRESEFMGNWRNCCGGCHLLRTAEHQKKVRRTPRGRARARLVGDAKQILNKPISQLTPKDMYTLLHLRLFRLIQSGKMVREEAQIALRRFHKKPTREALQSIYEQKVNTGTMRIIACQGLRLK